MTPFIHWLFLRIQLARGERLYSWTILCNISQLPQGRPEGNIQHAVKKGKEKAGEGIRLGRKTDAHWRGARRNSASGVRCGVFAVKLEAFVLGSPAFHGVRKKSLHPSSGSYLSIHSTLPEHLCVGHCAGQKECVVGRADIITVFMSSPFPKSPLCLQNKDIDSSIQQMFVLGSRTNFPHQVNSPRRHCLGDS